MEIPRIITIAPEVVAEAKAESRIPFRTCTRCAVKYPLDNVETHFHKDAKAPDGFHSMCKNCRRRRDLAQSRENAALAIRANTVTRKLIGQIVSSADTMTVPHIAHLGQALLDVFGGVEGFARNVAAEYDAAEPGSQARLKYLDMVKQCISKASDLGATKNPPELMSDEDLQRAMLTLVSNQSESSQLANDLDEEDSTSDFQGDE